MSETDAGPIHVLWINAGLSCDGDSVALTAATQPSVEEIALGALPGLPAIAVHWPLIDFESGPVGGADDFLEWFRKADRGELEPFVLVVEGSIPNEELSGEGYWCGFGNDPVTNQPITTNEWLDRLTPKALAVVAVGTCATYGGIHAMAGNPTGAMGVPDYLGWDWKSKAGIPIVCVPGCPIHPDNLAETLTYLLYMATGQAPMIPLDEALRPQWLFGQTVHEGCDRAGYYEQGVFADEYGAPTCIVKLGCWGPVVNCNVPKRGLGQRRRRLPERRWHLHRLHDARVPRQVHAVHGRAAGRQALERSQQGLRGDDPAPPRRHQQDVERGTEVAQAGPRAPHGLQALRRATT